MKRSLFRLFIMCRKLTSYPCVRGISVLILYQRKQALFHLFNNHFLSCVFVWTERGRYSMWDAKRFDSTRSQDSMEVHLAAKCYLMASSWCMSAQTMGADCGEHLSWARRHFVLSIIHVLACHWHVTSGYSHLLRHMPAPVWGACVSMSAGVCVCMCLWESGDDSTFIFSPVHWVLLLYYALFLGQAALSSTTTENTGMLSDPDPPAPTRVGETYKIPGR